MALDEKHGETVEVEEVEAALDESGFAWRRREGGWVIPAAGRLPRPIEITRVPAGIRVEAVLMQWDEIGVTEEEAVGRLLCQAQLGLRFARCELDTGLARVVALVAADQVEGGLMRALGGVAAGARLLSREIGALLVPDVARVFLDFCRAERKAAPEGA